MSKTLEEFDGVRIDHPHGLVCPWVYRTGPGDPFAAVAAGARLFDSPDLSDHPGLAAFAIVRPEQLNRQRTRFDDGWVSGLDDAQVRRYAVVFDAMMECVTRKGRALADVHCEVLSTWPYPLWRVMRHYKLGRMRVTQKASLTDATDVYRSEHAEPNDWIMVGNHDTPTLWALVRKWRAEGQLESRAAHLAEQLEPDRSLRVKLARQLASTPGRLAEAMFAELFASRATSVSIFFADLLGLEARYNLAGTVDPNNWMLRVPASYQASFAEDALRGDALHLPRVLRLALRARGVRVPQSLLALMGEANPGAE